MSINSPTVLILAGGENSRFFPLNTETHKGALPLLGQPIMLRTLENLKDHGYSNVVIVVSEKDYGGRGISGVIAEANLSMQISYVLQEKPEGMGAAVLLAKEQLGEHFVVVFPHLFKAGELIDNLVKHAGKDGTLAVGVTETPWLYGIVTIDGDRVTGIVEKPAPGDEPSNLYAQGVYLLSADFLPILESEPMEQYSFESALDKYLDQHQVQYYQQAELLPSLKFPWHLYELLLDMFGTQSSRTAQEVFIAPTAIIDDTLGQIIIEKGARVGHAARIVGPCYIGEHALVGDFSFVRGSSIEARAQIGANTEVVRSIFFQDSEMHFGYIADSIVGQRVKIGAGFLTANKRHDRQHIQVLVKDKKVDIGRNNLGVVIGAEAKVGVRATTMPGVMIGAGAVIYPSMTLYKNVEKDEVVDGK